MIRLKSTFLAVAILGGLAASAVPAAADAPTLLGVTRSWSSYTSTTNGMQVCYALSQPFSSLPKKSKRDPIYFLINDWPSRHAKAEMEFVPGYKYKDGAKIAIDIGGRKFAMFGRNDPDGTSAWVQSVGDQATMLDAMSRATAFTVSGVSARGTATKDTISLAGFNDAMANIHKSCNL